uniref:adenosylcobinamide-GDP ribazoletransferase n=1 Tax=Eubacterium cellulosolvens TaxID=29322 RepID=UPI000481ED4E|nr:adenosylcobinamide-GDP ribazoletransferase [[Eubacterium] cellulosolvens]
MKRILKNAAVAFSMYSRIPMPQFVWNDESMRYALCFFPFIGLLIGLFAYLWFTLCSILNIGPSLFAAGIIAIPLILTGGIHFDGFMDTSDALSSWRPTEERLRILKDSHVGAFAVIRAAVYLLLAYGASAELYRHALPSLCLGFAISRCLSGISVVTFPSANPDGSAAAFSTRSGKNVVREFLFFFFIVLIVCAFILDLTTGVLMVFAALVALFHYHRICMKYFGGMTGDLAGYFVCNCELFMLLTVVIGSKIVRLFL